MMAVFFGLIGCAVVAQSSSVSTAKGLAATVVCGAIVAFLVDDLRVKLRRAAAEPSPIEVRGGVEIHPVRTRGVIICAWMIAFGPAWFDLDPSQVPGIRWLGFWFSACGLWFSIELATVRWKRTRFIRFDEAGYTFGRDPFRVSIAWDDIASARVGAVHGRVVLLLDVRHTDAVTVVPADRRATWDAIVIHNRKTACADVASEVEAFGYGAPQMAAAIRRYAERPEARAELA